MNFASFAGFGTAILIAAAVGCASPEADADTAAAPLSETTRAAAPPVEGSDDGAIPIEGSDRGPACTPLASSPGANPAAAYCAGLGYGVADGRCVFGDGASCEAWAFFRGQCGGERSFCRRQGGSIATRTEDMGSWTATYAVCTLPGGRACMEDAFASTCRCESSPNPPAPACTALAAPAPGANPAAAYCAGLGHTVTDGHCAFGDGTSCEAWMFYRGECGGAHSFCARQGGTITNETAPIGGWSASVGICTLPSGARCKEDAFAHTCRCE